MQPLIWEHRPDGLRAPALVCAFTGWNDAGDAASAALQFLGASLGATRFARIDPEDFYDFQATRPKIKLIDGRTRSVEWPEVEIYEARIPRAPRDLVLLQGAEPSMRWRSFCKLIVDLAEALGTQMVVTLGALLADVPHSRPVPITGPVLRRGPRPARRAQPIVLRGPDRDRRRAARRLPGGRRADRLAVGVGAALRRRRPQPEGRARAGAQARGPRRRLGRRGRARVRRRRLRAPGLARRPERPRRAGLRRAPRAGGRGGGAAR